MSAVSRPLPVAAPDRDLAGALHEVSNALTVVLGWLGDARAKVPPGPVREALEVAYSHAHRGHTVARRAIGGDNGLECGVRSCHSLATDALRAAAREAESRGVQLMQQEDDVDVSLAAPDAVLQILVNLLLNAVAFSPRGGVVQLSWSVNDSSVCMRVSDEGPGVPDAKRPSIFLRGPSMRPGGAGIGLSHSHGLAEKHGGQLRLANSEKGAVFELDWPISDAPSRTSQRVPSTSLNGMRVLVLEDDAAVMAMVQMGLAARGIEVLPAGDIDEVVSMRERGLQYDAAFVDLSPIQNDPAGALAELRHSDANLPVILISGSANMPEVDLQLSAWVAKPFEVSELCDALIRVAQPAG